MSLFGGGGGETTSESTTTNIRYGANPAESQGFDLWSALWGPLFQQQGYNLTSTDRLQALKDQGADPAFIAKVEKAIGKGRLTNQMYGMEQAELTPEQQMQKQIEDQIFGRSLDTLNAGMGGGISPEVRAELNKIYAAQEAETFGTLQRRGIEASGMRGMNFSDTPIFAPFMREMAGAALQREGMKARDILSQNAAAMQRAQGLREFQTNLQQQKFNNTFNLSSAAGNMASQLYQTRANRPRQIKTVSKGTGTAGGSALGGISGGLGGLGQMMQFIPSIAGMFGGGAAGGGAGMNMDVSGMGY